MYTPYLEIFNDFHPELISLKDWEPLRVAFQQTNLLVCGEIHGTKENAHAVYTLCKNLAIKQLAIECPSPVKAFIDSGIDGDIDFSLIDPDMFESSMLSIEMAKTIIVLVKEGIVKSVAYIDTYYDNDPASNTPSPQQREEILAQNLLNIDSLQPTLCIMGQWHTKTEPTGEHLSALYRARKINPSIAFIHSLYRQGEIYNDGQTIALPFQPSVPDEYLILQQSDIDFEQTIPFAHRISLPKNEH